MSIKLTVSNSLKPLAGKISENLRTLQNNPFAKQWIITQTEGMNNWLKYSIANQLGIAANIQFYRPNDVLAIVFRMTGSLDKKILDQETMKWCLYNLLDDPSFIAQYPGISQYYIDNNIKKIALANELADLFDQYQLYRPEIIQEWNKELAVPNNTSEWQKHLWILLKERLQSAYQDKTEMGQKLRNSLSDPLFKQAIQTKIPALHFFGLAIIAPFYLNLLNELGNVIDIYFYMTNPAPEQYWLEDKSEKQIARLSAKNKINNTSDEHVLVGNDLLLNWGSIVKNTYTLLFEKEEIINNYNELLVRPDQEPPQLIKKIQADIYHNTPNALTNGYEPHNIKDGSVTINGCYTPLREVEVFYNYLVALIDKQGVQLSPRDIVVMVSDIDYYAPFIHAIFGNSKNAFPYKIADETVTTGNNMFAALKAILNMDDQTLKAEDVLDLLGYTYIKNRFKIQSIKNIRQAVREAGIFWGDEGREADATYVVSWKYGLNKMLYGLCIAGAPNDFVQDAHTLIPLDTAEGAEGFERIKLIHFYQILTHYIQERKTDKTIAEWAQYLKNLMEDMVFQSAEKEDEDHPVFVAFIENLIELDEHANVKISFDVFRHSLITRLDLERKSHSFSTVGITFCSFVPMRSIPFKVVGLLGMNFDKFPRKETPLSFSLMQKEKRIGDRNPKENDKHLFLETLLSAEEYLYISFISKDSKDGSDLPPSSLVDELIDYTAKAINIDSEELKKKWITVHPLHGFSKKYFNDSGLINYLSESYFKTNSALPATQTTNSQGLNFDEIKLNDFIAFFHNPPKYFLNKRLNIYYKEEEENISESEPFDINQLEKWIINNELIYLPYDQQENYITQKKLSGKLPLANMGKVVVKQMAEELVNIKNVFQLSIADKNHQPIDIQLTIDHSTIKGTIEEMYDQSLVSVCNSKNFQKYIIRAYLKYLLLKASNIHAEMLFIWKGSEHAEVLDANFMSQQEAYGILTELVQYFKAGNEDYFYFYPALAKKKYTVNAHEQFMKLYEAAINNARNFDFNDDYLNKAVEHGFFAETNYTTLTNNVANIFAPLKKRFPHLFE
jgi:exodeoxyribonuclease V gamma subunit